MFKKGYKNSLETRRKMSESHKKSEVAKAHLRDIIAGNTGKKQSPETVAKRVLKLKGRVMSPEARAKMSRAKKGKPLSAEHRKKLSIVGHRRVNTPETRKKIGDSNRGSKNWNWKGGVSSEHHVIRQSAQYKEWRTAVFERDGYLCIWGGKEHGNRLQADHIKRFADYPELRFELSNGRTLCIPCHKTTDTYGGLKRDGKGRYVKHSLR